MKSLAARLIGNVWEFGVQNRQTLCWAGVISLLLGVFLFIGNTPTIADEGFHLWQIQLFLKGNFSICPALTVPPVYHAILAAIFKLIGIDALIVGRLISFLGSLGCILIFFLLSRRITPDTCQLRTIQFIFFPLNFPFFFLLYTDIWALGAVLLSFERAVARKAWQSAAAVAFAVAMRPPNVVWALFVFAVLVAQEHPPANKVGDWFRRLFKIPVRVWLPFALLFLGFLTFVCLNHGVAVGDRRHQQPAFNISNVWFFLLLFPLLFFPNCLAACKALRPIILGRAIPFFAGTGLLFLTYFPSYRITHQYNQPGLWFYLRNRLLYYTTRIPAIKCLAFLPVVVGAIGFFRTPLLSPVFVLFIPITLGSILPFPLIEQRYYMVPMALFLLFRTMAPGEVSNTVYYFISSLVLVFCIAKSLCFL